MSNEESIKRIEKREEVQTYFARLKYALSSDATKINFIQDRKVDEKRNGSSITGMLYKA